MKLTAEIVFPVVLTLDRVQKEILFKMIKVDLKNGSAKKRIEIGLDRNILEYLVKHFERSCQRNKLKKVL